MKSIKVSLILSENFIFQIMKLIRLLKECLLSFFSIQKFS